MKAKFLPFYIISILPLPVLYFMSDVLFLIAYYVIGYRRKVVSVNLRTSFVDKSEKELIEIEKKFYKHFCDVIIETIKGLTINRASVEKRLKIKNMDVIQNYYENNQSILLYTAHQGNWEWLTFLSLFVRHKGVTLYQQLSNKYFDDLMKHIRERFGTNCIKSSHGYRNVLKYAQEQQPMLLAIIGDQCPGKFASKHWTDFLNKKTAFLVGADRIATKTKLVALFPSLKKTKRGFYELEFKTLDIQKYHNENKNLIDQYAKTLEETISESPELWLWSHRRWKLSISDDINTNQSFPKKQTA